MKKVILFCLLVLLLTGCGAKGTKLTLDNYKDYFTTGGSYITNLTDDKYRYGADSGYKFTAIDSIEFEYYVKGVSDNVNYEDVQMEITLFGEARPGKCDVSATKDSCRISWHQDYPIKTFEYTFTIDTNIAGDGSFSETITAADIFETLPNGFDQILVNYSSSYLPLELTVKVTDIKGVIVDK